IECKFQISQAENKISKNEDSVLNENNEKELSKLKKERKKLDKTLKIQINKLSKIEEKNKNVNEDLIKVLKEIVEYPKSNFIIWFSIDNKTFSDEMPEVWDNWFKTPVEAENKKNDYDLFTNKEAEIGYKTDVKVCSYDQYHDSLKYRINDNLPLSAESAKYIKFAWLYILDNLVFYYKGLEYIIIPNLLSGDNDILKLIIQRLVQAKKNANTKKDVLVRLRKEEKKLKKNIDKLKKKKLKHAEEQMNLDNITSDIKQKDLGIIQEFNEQLLTIDEHINSVTIDYLFTAINRTNKSFEIKGTIADVIPSKMSKLVKQMRYYKIEDLVKLGAKDYRKTYLQDFFNRDELYFAVNSNSLNNANSILTERLYLAKLLLSKNTIKRDDLLKRFEFNRLYDYEHKKRIKNGVAEWIEYPDSFVEKESNLIQFLTTLNKIKE
ncbi:MAG: hypothetical protein U9Q83_11045, partial [Bacteroidota bacterium]|nr:hypothetical protein [Bacteroidota bacterium]